MANAEVAGVEADFAAYDWTNSEAWKSYWDGLFPMPPAAQINKYKRKFYKTKVNAALSLTAPEAASTSNGGSSAGVRANSTTSTNASTTRVGSASGGSPSRGSLATKVWGPIAESMLVLALLCAVLSILPVSLGSKAGRLSKALMSLGFIAATVSENGLPRKALEYWQLLLYSAHMQSLLMILSSLPLKNTLTIYSPAISAVSYVARRHNFSHPVLTRLQLNKAYLEVLVGFVALFGWITRINSFIGVLMYWNALRVLYAINAPTKRAFAQLNASITSFLAHPRVPPSVRSGYATFSSWVYSRCEPAVI